MDYPSGSESRILRLIELEEMHLSYILLHVRHGDPDPRPFRTFADSWYAYRRSQTGADFVDANFRPLWMNRGDLSSFPPRCRQVHALSIAAENVLNGVGPVEPLVRDHCIPLKRVRSEIIRAKPSNVGEVRQLMLRWYRCAVITDAEHGSLRGSLNADMPNWWSADTTSDSDLQHFARYAAAGIPIRIA